MLVMKEEILSLFLDRFIDFCSDNSNFFLMKKNLIILCLLCVCLCAITLVTCKKPKKEMVVSTGDVTGVTANSAVVSGTAIDLGEGAIKQGHYYAKTPGVSASSQKTESATKGQSDFTSELTNLDPSTTYYFKAYLSDGTQTVFGEERNFTTISASVPTVTSTTVSAITTSSAMSGGNITNDGGASVLARGICWSMIENPSITDNKTSDGTGTGVFTSSLTGLTAKTTYHLRAYATNSVGTAYGSDIAFTTTAIVVPTLTTLSVSSVTTTTAVSGGNVSDGGGAAVSARGVCYGLTANPTITDTKTTDGSGTGIFTSNLSGLLPATGYHLRAYATNSAGTAYGTDITFTTTAILIPSLTTTSASAVTTTTATSGGNVTSDGGASITVRGVCWSTTLNPTITDNKTSNGTGTGSFSSSVTGLSPSTNYHLRAYATNSVGTGYGSDITFTTNALSVPTLTTTAASALTPTTASSGGNITSDGGASVTVKGVCWSITLNPTIADSKTADGTGTGSFSSSVTLLTPATAYHLRAYATNSIGTAYGADITFTTTSYQAPTVTTASATLVTATTSSSGGNVTNDGGSNVTSRGVCYGTTANPTTAGSKTTDGLGTGTYVSALTGLTPLTGYHIRAYAINSVGTSYGSDLTFTTTAVAIPAVTTADISSIGSTYATGGGNVTSDGGAAVTARGICWSTAQNPTVADSKVVEGTGTGLFSSSISDLNPGTTYYVRSFATNIVGTAYGAQVSFATLKVLPVISTKDVSNISAMGCTSGGVISSAGGGTISAKGLCWGELSNPTLNDNVINNGTGVSSFNSSIISAVPGTTYYIRSFATNEAGTAYGDQKTFATSANVNYYSFETGMLPVGWSGLWTVSNSKSFVGSYCLTSLHGVSSSSSLSATLANSGQISFYYYLDWSTSSGFSVSTKLDFYIDDVLTGTFPASSGWNQGLFNVTAGTHTFKWSFTQYYNDGQGYIDYIIFPQ
jgi:hypothetical protein